MNYHFLILISGEHDVSKSLDTEIFKAKVLKTGQTKHPLYYSRQSIGTMKFDIALLELERPVNFTKFDKIRY